jgi:hypothetical protein
MRFALPVLIALVGGVLALAKPAEAAQCVTMIFFDQYGAVIPTPQPVVAIMLGGQPALNGAGPPYFSKKVGQPVPCPEKVVETIQKLFDESCSSEQRRTAAARDNKVPIANIDKGCANMMETLRPPPPQ